MAGFDGNAMDLEKLIETSEIVEPSTTCGLIRRTSSKVSKDSRPCFQTSSQGQQTSTPPTQVILCLWPGATQDQINRYVDGYTTLYPTAQVHSLHSSLSHSRPGTSEELDNVLNDITPTHDGKAPHGTVLLHLFGQSGAAQACSLLRAYRIRTSETLPVKAVISDTEPTFALPSLDAASRTPTQLLLVLYSLVVLLCSAISSILQAWQQEAYAQQTRADLTNPKLLPTDARKCYVFAHRDAMFSWAETLGLDSDEYEHTEHSVKREAVDRKTGWTGDQERYWLGIESAWDGL